MTLGLAQLFDVSSWAATPVTNAAISPAVQWMRWEIELKPEKSHVYPYESVNVDVRFSGPRGESFLVPAYWDGEEGVRVRAAFPAPGMWSWRSTCNDSSDKGLHAREGMVRVTPYVGDNALYLRGDLRLSENRRYLIHADGTPFLWMGDTGWNTIWKTTPNEWREYIDVRVSQRFSVIQVLATGAVPRSAMRETPASGRQPFQADGTPDPLYWRDLDAKVAYANERGLFVMLTGLGKSRGEFSEQQGKPAFARYVAGRVAGSMVILSPSMDQRIDPLNEEVGARLRPLTSHLVAQHPGTHLPTAQRYHDSDYTHFTTFQTGHHSGQLDRVYDAARSWTLDLWHRSPVKPVINAEAMYDGRGNDDGPAWREQDVRALGWISWLCGSRGYTYGAGDVPPKVPGASGGIWLFNENPDSYDYWRKAVHWPSAGQMTILREFFAGIAWWQLEPVPAIVRNQSESPLLKVAISRSTAGDLLVAYLPENSEIVIDLSSLSEGLKGQWFNPKTAGRIEVRESLIRGSAVTLRPPLGWSDAVLLLTAQP